MGLQLPDSVQVIDVDAAISSVGRYLKYFPGAEGIAERFRTAAVNLNPEIRALAAQGYGGNYKQLSMLQLQYNAAARVLRGQAHREDPELVTPLINEVAGWIKTQARDALPSPIQDWLRAADIAHDQETRAAGTAGLGVVLATTIVIAVVVVLYLGCRMIVAYWPPQQQSGGAPGPTLLGLPGVTRLGQAATDIGDTIKLGIYVLGGLYAWKMLGPGIRRSVERIRAG